jgi:hypothetical protein
MNELVKRLADEAVDAYVDWREERATKPRVMEVTDPNRDLFSCMRGEHGVSWYVLASPGGLTLPTLIVTGFLSIVLSG